MNKTSQPHSLIERRDRKSADTTRINGREIIAAVEGAARQQKLLGLGDPSVAIDRTKKRMRIQILKSQANDLAAVFAPVQLAAPELLPRTEKFGDFVDTLPEIVICQLKPGTSHARCTVGHGIPNVTSKRYEAPIPVLPTTVLELASRAKAICPELEFHLVLKPSWTEVPQRDPILLGRVPELDEYFEIGSWDGDSVFISELLSSRNVTTK